MGKTKKIIPLERRQSPRLGQKLKSAEKVEKTKPPAKKAATKVKKAKTADNGTTKAEEPKAEATEAK